MTVTLHYHVHSSYCRKEGRMKYSSKIVLDSVSPANVRLITVELTYPLIVHNEFLTHRAIGRSDDHKYDQWLEASRNSSSNRAIPSSRIIEEVMTDPYVPLRWGRATTGMVPGPDLSKEEAAQGLSYWLWARDQAVSATQALDKKIHLGKQWRNRLLLPFQWITVVATANEEWWRHFIDLRNHSTAQDEIQLIAALTANNIYHSKPQELNYGEWHLPYILENERYLHNTSRGLEISVARCARTSHLRQGEVLSERDDLKLYEDLRYPKTGKEHASPLEHQGMATHADVRSGNFIGWEQNRKVQGL
jgi:hypothetical protein